MLFRMLRTQTSEHGTFRMGVAYDAGKNAALIKGAKALIAAGLAEEVTAKQLDQEKTKAEKLAVAQVNQNKSGKESSAIRALKAAEAKAKEEADAAKASEAEAKAEAESAKAAAADAKAEAEALAERVKELEAQVAAKDSEQSEK